MLAVLAAKRRWKLQRKAAGKDFSNPNIVMSSAVHCVFEKACNYFEVEPKYWCKSSSYRMSVGKELIEISQFSVCSQGKYALDPQEAVDLVDENTCLFVCILGTTYTGE